MIARSRFSVLLIIFTLNITSVFILTLATTSIKSMDVIDNIESEASWTPVVLSQQSSEISMHENDYSQKTFVGDYANIRSKLDYNYHSHYPPQRQLLQDAIIRIMMNTTIIRENQSDAEKNNVNQKQCSTPASNPWIVFTAGAMGAGKTHTIRQLHEKEMFPLDAFVSVDPDEIRRHLPEFQLYVQNNPTKAGELTRKEAGYISEILTWVALDRGKNVLVDGSLRDHEWYKNYFQHLRNRYIDLKIAILHVTASKEDVLQRALKRGLDTGRIVPVETLKLALDQVPASVKILSPLVDFFCELYNGSNEISSTSNQQFQSRNISNGHPNDVQIVVPNINWESFQMQWRQFCQFPDDVEQNMKNNNVEALTADTTENNNMAINEIIGKSIDKGKSKL